MGFWFFMLAMNLIIPLSMIFLGKYFSKHAPGQINMLFGYRTARSMKNQTHGSSHIIILESCGLRWDFGCLF